MDSPTLELSNVKSEALLIMDGKVLKQAEQDATSNWAVVLMCDRTPEQKKSQQQNERAVKKRTSVKNEEIAGGQ